MRFIRSIYYKLLYIIYAITLKERDCKFPDGFRGKKQLFIYFDYEREFGGHSVNIQDSDVAKILQILNETGLKTTWFAVGKVIEKYPDSIRMIQSGGHELGSHTYAHIAPVRSSRRKLKLDFLKFNDVSLRYGKISGFHSPNGMWSMNMKQGIIKYEFQYDVVSRRVKHNSGVFISNFESEGRKFLRLFTVGDDWPLYRKKPGSEEVFAHFMSLLNKIEDGQLGGIGIHPWVIFSDDNILKGFQQFIYHIAAQENVQILPAGNYASEILEINHS
jgi:peptidoglycan-N-acetylglucosamine deacetylase